MNASLKIAIASCLIGSSAMLGLPNANAASIKQTNTALSCQGTIHDRINFTVSYQPNRGFYRAEFRPKISNQTFQTELRYIGKERNKRGVWHGAGSGNINADVALVHLSTHAPQRGDRVSIAYDGQWGRGTCR